MKLQFIKGQLINNIINEPNYKNFNYMYIKTKKRDWFSYKIAPWIVLYKIITEENVKKSFLY